MNNRFKKGDLIKHSCAGNMDHMDAIFIKYKPGTCPQKAIVEYTKGFRKGNKGEWLVEYLISIDVTSKIPPGLYGATVNEVIHDDHVDAAVYMGMDMAKPGADHSVNLGMMNADLSDLEDRVAAHFVSTQEYTTLNNEEIMKAKITELYENGVLTQTLINDRDIKDLGSGQLMGYIGDANAAIEKLTKHDGSKCKFIGQELKRMHQFIDSVYLILDEKFYKKTEIPEVK